MKVSYCAPEGYYLLGQGKYAEVRAEAVVSRFKAATGSRTESQLASWLGVNQAIVSDIKRRNIVPTRWLYLLLDKQTQYNPIWVLIGRGAVHIKKCWSSGPRGMSRSSNRPGPWGMSNSSNRPGPRMLRR